ncbi:protein enabled isoform X2 [Agrilus planipennis]|nr:protein enabled isoform X2 [Agrilus planipennis]
MYSIEFQRFAMFPAINDPQADYNNTEIYGKGIRNFYVTTNETENIVLGVWHLLPDSLVETLKENDSFDYDEALKNKTYNIILYFHGNSGNRISPLNTYEVLRQFFHVIAFDYRGYGDSTSAVMSEENVVEDCVELYKWLTKETNNTIYVWGHSLGSALATHTVAKLHCLGFVPFGLFLEAPFNNMAEEVIYHPMGKILSWLPWFKETIINPLMNNGFKFETDKTIAMVDCPVLILNAEDDDTVPSFLVKKLLIAAQDQRNFTYQGLVLHHEFPKHFGYGHQYIHRAPDLPNLISEQSIASARASVMVYDDVNKKWIPSGSSSGLSKVHIYQHTVQQTFRVVGRKLQDHEVVINCAIIKGLKYNQATSTFHQWRDSKHVYGLNFSSKEDADQFARAMFHSLEVLSNMVRQPQPPQQSYPPVISQPQQLPPQQQQQQQPQQLPQQPPQPPAQQQYDEDMGYRTMTREDVANLQERRISAAMMSPQQQTSPMTPQTNVPVAPALPFSLTSAPSPVSPSAGPGGHQRNSSVPPAPPPPPSGSSSGVPGLAPPVPSHAVGSLVNQTAAPPPPPPPPMNISRSQSSDGGEVNSLAAQLQNARLKRNNKNTPPPTENSGSSTSSGGSSNYGTLGRGGGSSMASMMDEMAKTLARRRAAVDKTTADKDEEESKAATWEKSNTLPNPSSKYSESPKSVRKRFGSASEETILKVNGLSDSLSLGPTELESLKNEIVKEIRKELGKMKQEILDAIKTELNRR